LANLVNGTQWIPLGCSCISQFQLNSHFGEHSYVSQLFDWNIVTPDALVQIFDSRFAELREAVNSLAMHGPSILKANSLPGFYWWHADKLLGKQELLMFNTINEFENAAGQVFRDKLEYQIQKFLNIQDDGRVIFVWSNAQPNLKLALPQSWDCFYLSAMRLDSIVTSVKSIFPNCQMRFAVRPEISDSAILSQRNVFEVSAPLGDDHKGAADLFSATNIFE